jgi:hypothetical protein
MQDLPASASSLFRAVRDLRQRIPEEARALILRVTDVPPSLNKVLRMHWAKKRGLLEAWRWMIKAAFGQPGACDGKRRVKITLFHSRFFDKDNAYGACKVIFDALKAEGFIVDDRAEWLEATVEQEKCKHKERHTVIEIEAAPRLAGAVAID